MCSAKSCPERLFFERTDSHTGTCTHKYIYIHTHTHFTANTLSHRHLHTRVCVILYTLYCEHTLTQAPAHTSMYHTIHTLMRTHSHTGTRTHEYILYTLYYQLKPTINRDMWRRKMPVWSGKHGMFIVWGKINALRLDLNECKKGCIRRGIGRSVIFVQMG